MVHTEQIDLVDSATSTAPLAPCLLVADDQPHILDAIELLVRPQGYRVERARSPQMVLDALLTGSYDALLIDLNYTRDTTSGKEGLDLLAQVAAARETLSKSRGKTHDCSRFSPIRSTCITQCVEPSASRPRTVCSGHRAFRK